MIKKVWQELRQEASSFQEKEPHLNAVLEQSVLKHDSFGASLAAWAGTLISNEFIKPDVFAPWVDETIEQAVARDLHAVYERDPACTHYIQAFLSFKGFKSLLAYRFAHKIWGAGQHLTGLLIQGRMGDLWDIDIHPAAKIGSGIMMDHASGIVIGETAEVGDDTSILHSVTLGGRGNARGDRHPKIGKGVFIGTGASILGNIKVNDFASIAAGSIVLQDVPANATAVGAPARIIETKNP